MQALAAQGSRLVQHEAALADMGNNLQAMFTQQKDLVAAVRSLTSQLATLTTSPDPAPDPPNPHLRCNPLTTVIHAFQPPNGTTEISVPAVHSSRNALSCLNNNPIHSPTTEPVLLTLLICLKVPLWNGPALFGTSRLPSATPTRTLCWRCAKISTIPSVAGTRRNVSRHPDRAQGAWPRWLLISAHSLYRAC